MINTISFPKLNISLNINRVAFSVFGKPIYWYAIIIITGFILATLFVMKIAEKRGISSDSILDISLYGLIFGLIGARIYYVIFDPSCLNGSLLNIFKIWEGGIAIYGAIIAAVITAYIYCKRHKLPVFKVFDLAVQGLFIGQIIGRWGNFVNAEVYGGETTLPWGMSINGSAPVHPLFIYESIWNLVGLVIVWIFGGKAKNDGYIFFFYILWYGIGRLLLEGMRQSTYMLMLTENVGISQVVATLGILIGLCGIVYLKIKGKTVDAEKF